MARYFITKATLSDATTQARRVAGRGEAATVYVVDQSQPPMFLVGPPTAEMIVAGATPLFTVFPDLGPEGDLRERSGELEATVALLKDENARLQQELATANRHLNPPLGANRCNPGECENVGDCCFCDRRDEPEPEPEPLVCDCWVCRAIKRDMYGEWISD